MTNKSRTTFLQFLRIKLILTDLCGVFGVVIVDTNIIAIIVVVGSSVISSDGHVARFDETLKAHTAAADVARRRTLVGVVVCRPSAAAATMPRPDRPNVCRCRTDVQEKTETR